MYNSFCFSTISNSKFVGNNSQSGGGAYNYRSSPTVMGCFFSRNNAMLSGGGLYNNDVSSNFVNLVFSENSAQFGGGMYNLDITTLSFTNSLFWNNSAVNGGGAIYNDNSSPFFDNCTITGNNAQYGGAFNNVYSSPILYNSIVWGNKTGIYNYFGNPSAVNSNVQDSISGSAVINQNPQFVNPVSPAGADSIFGTTDDGLILQITSPCIDKGSNFYIPTGITTDITGMPRTQGGTVDMGAYESLNSVLPLALTSFTVTQLASTAQLAWATTIEQNTAGFNIERSTDGSSFLQIGKVKAIGNSSSTNNYSFLDATPVNGNNYYRLKMMDNDGRFTYSSTRLISFSGTANILVYPSTVTDYIHVSGVDAGTIINIIALDGRRLFTQQAASNTQKVSVGNLTSGMYLLQAVRNGVVTSNNKFFKQ